MLIQYLFQNPSYFITWLFAIVVGISVHEFFHAWAAYLQGDRTAQYAGRLTLNPLAHLDPLGSAMLLFLGFGYGKPVPFNPNNLRNRQYGPALVGAAGPFSNLLMIFVFGLTLRFLLPVLGDSNLLSLFLYNLVQVNVILLVFNLFPIPPLDGSKVLFAILPKSLENVRIFLEQYGPWVLLALLFFGQGIFTPIFDYFRNLSHLLII
ncbi:MAG: site-2 protease family protein [Patescibacteria group bacterium]